MRILYVARHGPHDNQDEDAISHALRQLGHEVLCLPEDGISRATEYQSQCDFALFHRPDALSYVSKLTIPKCFYYFDLIRHAKFARPLIMQQRELWMRQAVNIFDLGFITDGDYAATHSKLVHLMQGADERVMGFGDGQGSPVADVVFTGTAAHGGDRKTFVQEMESVYGSRFKSIGRSPGERKHGRELANLLSRCKIVVAPDCPVTDLYWSNRVYQILGMGCFLIHPWCDKLTGQYEDRKEILYYLNRDHLHELISYYLPKSQAETRRAFAEAGLRRTISEHLYRHRCEFIVNEMSRRFLNGKR